MVEENQLMPTTYHYFKSDKEFKTIKEYENIEEKYANGQLKTKGVYHNGFEDGLWEEWFENDKRKVKENLKTDWLSTGLGWTLFQNPALHSHTAVRHKLEKRTEKLNLPQSKEKKIEMPTHKA